MSLLSAFVALSVGLFSVQAAPTPGDLALARKYAPEWRFHDQELYWPSTVEFFLNGVDLVDTDGNVVNANPTVQTVDDNTNQGADLFLFTDIDSNKDGFLRGQQPSATNTKVYTFIVPKDNGIVDLYYWLFTPFNLAKSVPVVGEVGDHVGDWERMTVRTVNGTATEVDYHAHSDSGSGTLPWSEVEKFDNDQRPVGYVANGSHGFWATAGTFTYVNAVIFQLQDETSASGLAFDTADSIFGLSYPDTYSGDLDWLNYKGAWGNEGETDCWWHVFYDECEVVTGPTGPVRDDVLNSTDIMSTKQSTSASMSAKMQGPLSQVMATTAQDKSSYTVYINDATASFASKSSDSSIAVWQSCASNATTTGTTSLSSSRQYTIDVPACADSSVAAYALGLCSSQDASTCKFSTASRAIRAFSADPNTRGIQNASAVTVNDLISWNLS